MKLRIYVPIFLMIGALQLGAQGFALYYTGPQSSIARGNTELVTSTNGGSLFPITTYGNGLHVMVDRQTDNWSLDFESATGVPLTSGLYTDAARWPFNNSVPGMDMNIIGSGYNILNGSFNVLDVSYSGGNVSGAAVDFYLYGENLPDRWVWGSFRWNSDIPITTIPEPHSGWLVLVGFLAFFRFRR